MAPNRIMLGGGPRRGLLATVCALALLTLAGCGGGGGGGDSTAAFDRDADAEILNQVLGRQTAAVGAYGEALPGLRGADRAMAELFRAQEQEHVDAIVKALRGMGAEAEPAEEEIEAGDLASARERLEFLYALESATIDSELSAISKLTAPWPRSLLGSIVANQAQHLTLLRRALGAGPLQSVPEPFENGTTPDPSEMMDR